MQNDAGILNESPGQATAVAHPNIAFIKYWGNINDAMRIPANGSISMNLDALSTRTTVGIDPQAIRDRIAINGNEADERTSIRISGLLDNIRSIAGHKEYSYISSTNNFPSGSGIASSASGFAALATAAAAAYGLTLDEQNLSALARRGSGSACRSIPGGFVEWFPGDSTDTSYASSIAPPEHWDLMDLVVIVDPSHKTTGSSEGHTIAPTSPLQSSRVKDTPRRLNQCRKAILEKDFFALANIVEQDCLMMHTVMMTSSPGLFYWKPATLDVIQKTVALRERGLPVFYTIDAGPNVHIITTSEHVTALLSEVKGWPGIQSTIVSGAGGKAYITD